MRPARLLLLFVLLACSLLDPRMDASASQQSEEEKMGRDHARSIERRLTMLDDPAMSERVRRIGAELALIANQHEVKARYGDPEITRFNYEFKVVDDPDVNAFCLPGGLIYVNSGLIELVDSDDELAGVIAHEIAHAAHHHSAALIKRQSKVDRYVALVALAAILGKLRGSDMNNVLVGAQMMKAGTLSGYTQEAEKDADRTAVAYLARSRYSPRGLLTFMKKLETRHEEDPGAPLGIFQTHPPAFRRAAAILRAMKEEGIELNLRKTQDIAYAKTVPVKDSDGACQVVISNRVVWEPCSSRRGASARDEADRIARRINEALDSGAKPEDIVENHDRASLMLKGQELLRIETDPDESQRRDLLGRARSALEYAMWADWLCNTCPLTQDEDSSY